MVGYRNKGKGRKTNSQINERTVSLIDNSSGKQHKLINIKFKHSLLGAMHTGTKKQNTRTSTYI